MKITPVTFNNYQINFQNKDNVLNLLQADIDNFKDVSCDNPLERGGIIYNQTGKIYNRNKSFFFRNDFSWYNFGLYLREKYKDNKKINIYDYACGNGLEAYSLSILIQTSQKKPQRFFPIIAKDIDKKIIEENILRQQKNTAYAPSIEYFPHAMDSLHIKKDAMDKFAYTRFLDDTHVTLIRPIATKKVEFSYGNILDDVDKFDNKNPSIVFARNVWPYINSKEYDEFCTKLYKRLTPNSIILIGNFDTESSNYINKKYFIKDALIKAGFKPKNLFKTQGRYKSEDIIAFVKE